jgi:hypothetical protein
MGSLCDRENLKLYLSVQALIKLFERVFHPCRCLWRGSGQMTRTTPLRRMILHLRQILFTDALTFIVALLGSASAAVFYIARNVISPFVRSARPF